MLQWQELEEALQEMAVRSMLQQYPDLLAVKSMLARLDWHRKPVCSLHCGKAAGLRGGRYSIKPHDANAETCDGFVLVDVAHSGIHPNWAVQGPTDTTAGVRNTPVPLFAGSVLRNRTLCALRVDRILRVSGPTDGQSSDTDLVVGRLFALKAHAHIVVGFMEYKPAQEASPIEVPSVLVRDSNLPEIQFAVPLSSVTCMLVITADYRSNGAVFLPCMKTL
jgi:hypothetical protein